MNDEHKAQVPIVQNFLDDARRIIEGGKNRRWEVFKWTIAFNVLFTTAAVTQPKSQMLTAGLFVAAFAVALSGASLIAHYDRRITKARDRARNLTAWIRNNAGIDMYAVMGETNLIPTDEKDELERFFFYATIALSLFAVTTALLQKQF